MPERTAGGLFLPHDTALAKETPAMPPFAIPAEPTGAGLAIDAGFASAYLITDPASWIAALDQTYVAIFVRPLASIDELVPLLEAVAQTARPITLVAAAFGDDVLEFLIVNKLRGTLNVTAIATPRGTEIAAHLGATLCDAVPGTVDGLTTAKRVASGIATTLIER